MIRMIVYRTVLWIFCLFHIRETLCIEPISATVFVSTIGAYFGYQAVKCSFNECCNDKYIRRNTGALSQQLERNLFGQELAIRPIVSALNGHFSPNPRKALAIAFHGTPGTGKNYVASMIRDTLYEKGISSQYYHFFNGRSEFPLESQVRQYKERLKKTITEALLDCPQSLFVFDEVDDMAEGVLDVLVPFLDYGPTQVWIDSSNKVVETRQAIFIFLSNTGSQQIISRLMELWAEGKPREETSLANFEDLISKGAFNEKGGFHKSDTISTSLIDHYVPFLPLEHEHIKLCIKASFESRNIRNPTDAQIAEVMSYVTFGPDHLNLYANSGCKRIEQKVASIAYRRRSENEL